LVRAIVLTIHGDQFGAVLADSVHHQFAPGHQNFLVYKHRFTAKSIEMNSSNTIRTPRHLIHAAIQLQSQHTYIFLSNTVHNSIYNPFSTSYDLTQIWLSRAGPTVPRAVPGKYARSQAEAQ
jgi:hypothetical protein